MSFIDPSDEKQRKIHERVRALILQSSEKITQNIQMETGRISDTRLKKIQYFQGAGGKTYVIEAVLSTSLAGEIDGGIVLKFAKDLDAEVDNANRLVQLLKVRQKDWEDWKKSREVPERIRKYPDLVFAPEVIHVIPEVKTMILEFLGGFTPLLQVQFEKEAQWGYAGYALARLHGSKRQQTNIQLYNPLLKMLKSYIDSKYLDYWVEILEQSMGGIEFIHGDSHMSNIMVSPTRIAWIDAMMLPDLDRMDDIGYFISHAVQEHVTRTVGFSFNEDRLVNNITRSWVPLILATYKRTYDISQLYSHLPLDFFLGSHLIIRAGLWEEDVSSILIRLGQRFIYEKPISKMLED